MRQYGDLLMGVTYSWKLLGDQTLARISLDCNIIHGLCQKIFRHYGL